MLKLTKFWVQGGKEVKRLRLIGDHVLGTLLRVSWGFDKSIKGKVHRSFYENQVSALDKLEYSLLATEGLFECKTTLSPKTFLQAKGEATLLRQKAHGSYIGISSSHGGISSLLRQAEGLDKFIKYLKDKYGNEKKLDYEDSIRILQDYPTLNDTLFFHLIFTPEQTLRLRKYISKYYKQYSARELAGQEKLALPEVYANMITSKINSSSFTNLYGRKRVVVDNEKIPYFCHSVMYLLAKKQLKVYAVQILNQKIEATIDNLSGVSQFPDNTRTQEDFQGRIFTYGQTKVNLDEEFVKCGEVKNPITDGAGYTKVLVKLIEVREKGLIRAEVWRVSGNTGEYQHDYEGAVDALVDNIRKRLGAYGKNAKNRGILPFNRQTKKYKLLPNPPNG